MSSLNILMTEYHIIIIVKNTTRVSVYADSFTLVSEKSSPGQYICIL